MSESKRPSEGIRAVVEMLNLLETPLRERILRNVAAKDAALAEALRKQLFVFEDFVRLDDRELQLLLREVALPKLALALRKSSQPLKEKILKNLSVRTAKLLREELLAQGKKRLSEIEAAQSELLSIAKRLEGEGKLLLHKKSQGKSKDTD